MQTTLADRVWSLGPVRRSRALRTFLAAAWLGWQIDSNWADPLLFAIYTVARPIASVLILVVMYSVVTAGATDQPLFAYMYVGNALYMLVGMILTGVSWAVLDDREHYNTSRQLHTTPLSHYTYLLGRGVSRLAIGAVSVLITLGVGVAAFHLPLRLATIDWPLLLVAGALGITTLAALGVIMAGLTMTMARYAGGTGEAVAGAFYVFTGAIFPLEVLPDALRRIGLVLPVTYWLEAMRRALLGPRATGSVVLVSLSDGQLVLILLAFAALLVVLSRLAHRWGLHLAKERGLIDMESSY